MENHLQQNWNQTLAVDTFVIYAENRTIDYKIFIELF